MILTQLKLVNFRSFQAYEHHFQHQLTYIQGQNAAGKTSLLEAIFYLFYGSSFRSPRREELIQWQQSFFTISGRTPTQHIHVGRDNQGKRTLKVDDSPSSFKTLAQQHPILFIDTNSHRDFAHASQQRRKWLDWALFHVEPSFHAAQSRYQHALKQRNRQLKTSGSIAAISAWDPILIQEGEVIHQLRQRLIERLVPTVLAMAARCAFFPHYQGLSIDYSSGWGQGVSFAEALAANIDEDCRYKVTRLGPHKADFSFLHHGQNALAFFSQGQQKLLTCILKLALREIIVADTGHPCLTLIDDLAAEADTRVQEFIITEINAAQTIITGIIAPPALLSDAHIISL